jgi:hypothetical protein
MLDSFFRSYAEQEAFVGLKSAQERKLTTSKC